MSTSNFIKENFLLENKFAQELFHSYASKMPIIDYHCHLPPEDIAEDKVFENITKVWIDGDHYKWRAMRALGIEEKYITGNTSDPEKFKQWAKTVPYAMRNPLYHWTHLELARYFDIYDLLNQQSASDIYERASNLINTKDKSCRNLMLNMNVEVVCTTDDPIDNLEHHQKIAQSNFTIGVRPTFRPDKAIAISKKGFNSYIDKLEAISGYAVDSFDKLCEVLKTRIAYFHKNGCRLSDHGLDHIYADNFTESEVKKIYKKKREYLQITEVEALKFQSALLQFLSETYHEFGWVQQFHLGALRNNNQRMTSLLGPDTGWDSIGDYPQAKNLSKFLNGLDSKDKLTKSIIYNLNPADNAVMAAMIGNFNDGSVKGKVQFGSGWWFLDQKEGIIDQLNALSNMGLVSCFVGMLTDSRSFLSYPRHEYFRRILCNLFGDEIQRGELPNDMNWMGKLIEDICYNNAKEYFNFNSNNNG